MSDPSALKFAIQDVDVRVSGGEGAYNEYGLYRSAGHAARAFQTRRSEARKQSDIVAELRRSRGQE